ncbi:MAG: serine hydrolase domain-containing protein [Deltaproteobacteria bacterium]|nr:serine hydrolase domain-containing protein [Deltaproteobacteria bacterium]
MSSLQGTAHPDFYPVARALAAQLRRTPRGGGAAVCVYHRGDKVVDLWGGQRNDAGAAWQADTMSVSFSTTKGVTATALHLCVDRGLLDYDDRVARLWPEFAQAGKGDITIRQLLSHQAGLYNIRTLIDGAERMRDWQYMTDALARSAPLLPPGSASAYHGVTFGWLVGELVQRATGERFATFVQREIAQPLGLDGLFVGAPREMIGRAASLSVPERGRQRMAAMGTSLDRLQRLLSLARVRYDPRRIADALLAPGITDFAWDAPETLTASIPAANGLFTARALAKLYAVLGAGGALHGTRLLSERTLARATEVQTRRIDLVVPFPMHWRLGYHRAATTAGTPPRGFGHYGFGGSGAWCDPDQQLAVAMVLNSGIGTPFGDLRTAHISGRALRCARRRRR